MPRDPRAALSRAAWSGDAETVRSLLRACHDPNAFHYPFERPPLLDAAYWGRLDVLDALLEGGADPNLVHKGCSALSLAVEHGRAHIVRRLLALGVQTDLVTKDGGKALARSIASGEDEIALALIELGADVSTMPDHSTILLAAAWRGGAKLVQALLDRGVDIAATGPHGETALWHAAHISNLDALPILLAADTALEPLSRASIEGDEAAARSLLSGGADPNLEDARGGYPLIWASMMGFPGIAELLLDWGADVDIRGPWRGTPLLDATKRGHASVVRVLLRGQATVDATDYSGRPPLLWALSGVGGQEIAHELIEAGADVGFRDRLGQTPMYVAASCGYTDIVARLIAAGADVDARDDEGETPLMGAAQYGRHDVIRLLLDHGADVNATSRTGHTALKYADSRVEPCGTADLLRAAGAVGEPGFDPSVGRQR